MKRRLALFVGLFSLAACCFSARLELAVQLIERGPPQLRRRILSWLDPAAPELRLRLILAACETGEPALLEDLRAADETLLCDAASSSLYLRAIRRGSPAGRRRASRILRDVWVTALVRSSDELIAWDEADLELAFEDTKRGWRWGCWAPEGLTSEFEASRLAAFEAIAEELEATRDAAQDDLVRRRLNETLWAGQTLPPSRPWDSELARPLQDAPDKDWLASWRLAVAGAGDEGYGEIGSRWREVARVTRGLLEVARDSGRPYRLRERAIHLALLGSPESAGIALDALSEGPLRIVWPEHLASSMDEASCDFETLELPQQRLMQRWAPRAARLIASLGQACVDGALAERHFGEHIERAALACLAPLLELARAPDPTKDEEFWLEEFGHQMCWSIGIRGATWAGLEWPLFAFAHELLRRSSPELQRVGWTLLLACGYDSPFASAMQAFRSSEDERVTQVAALAIARERLRVGAEVPAEIRERLRVADCANLLLSGCGSALIEVAASAPELFRGECLSVALDIAQEVWPPEELRARLQPLEASPLPAARELAQQLHERSQAEESDK